MFWLGLIIGILFGGFCTLIGLVIIGSSKINKRFDDFESECEEFQTYIRSLDDLK